MPANYRRLLKPIVFIAVGLICMAGCHKRAPIATIPTPPIVELTPAPPAVGPIAPNHFPAITSNIEPLPLPPPPDARRDEELFHLGLTYASPENPSRDWQRATTFFRQLVNEFPESPFRPAAELLLNLRNEVIQLSSDAEKRDQRIKQLTAELERLKQIDADRRKRP